MTPPMKYIASVKYPPFLNAHGTGDTLEEALGMLGDVIDAFIQGNEKRSMAPAVQAQYATAKMLGHVGGVLTIDVYVDHTRP